MSNDKQLKIFMTAGIFAVAFLTYMATVAPTVSFWDCGELVGASNILGNPHPPGNPLFTILARVFIMFMPLQEIASRVNFISVLTSALTVTMIFLFMLKLLGVLFQGKLSRFPTYCAATIAAFLVTFSDTFWFSAVEAEVYGTSMLIVMTISWLSLHWYQNRGKPKADRTLILICYLGFLGMGIHPFSFITIPVVGLFIVMSDEGHRKNWLGFILVPVAFAVVAMFLVGGLKLDLMYAYFAVLLLSAVLVAAQPLMSFNLPFAVTVLGLMAVIYDIGDFIFYALAALLVCVVSAVISASPDGKRRWKLPMWLSIVAILGFSSYAYVPIRSSVGPNIDEGRVFTGKGEYAQSWTNFKEYLERKQYGSESMLRRAFHRRGAPVNQVLVHPHMGYGGYMLSQYFPWKVGETRGEDNEPVVRQIGSRKFEFKTLWTLLGQKPGLQFLLFVLFQLPFLYGGYLAWKLHPQVGLYILLLYGATSYGLVFYMNFADGGRMELRDYEYWQSRDFNPQEKPDPVHIEVRDRDYFFTPGFIFMGILFGVASAFLLKKLTDGGGGGRRGLPVGVGTALACLAVAIPAFSNYKEHDRGGDYVPWDYAYNLLESCRPNSILFTNGDNDTFPLWFLQEVENIRRDVRVVNLSLVNTNWYIHQLTEREPKLVIGFTSEEIDRMEPTAWNYKQKVSVKLPNSAIIAELDPRPYLKVQDIMVLHIVQNNYPLHPVHFAVTVSDDNMMGLEKYLVMEGMVLTLVEDKRNKELDAAVTARLVDSVYQFRGLGNPKVFIDLNTEGLLTNYSSTNFRLLMWAQEQTAAIDKQLDTLRARGDTAPDSLIALENERRGKIAFGEKYLNLNIRILPREWRNYYYGTQFYAAVKEYDKAEEFYRKGAKDVPNPKAFAANLAEIYMDQKQYGRAESLLKEWLQTSPGDFEVVYGLSEVYQRQGDFAKARVVLADWLGRNPRHQYSAMAAQQIQFLDGHMQFQTTTPSLAKPDSGSGTSDMAPTRKGGRKSGRGKDTAARGAAVPGKS